MTTEAKPHRRIGGEAGTMIGAGEERKENDLEVEGAMRMEAKPHGRGGWEDDWRGGGKKEIDWC
jgi:hypothetical protein